MDKMPPGSQVHVNPEQMTHEQLVNLCRRQARQVVDMRLRLNKVIEINNAKDRWVAGARRRLAELLEAI